MFSKIKNWLKLEVCWERFISTIVASSLIKEAIKSFLDRSFLGKPQRNFKNVLLNLVYPAILGAILYETMNFFYDLMFNPCSVLHWAKLTLLVITAIFYVVDYFYIKLTERFIGLFFVFDLFFLVFLFITIKMIGIDDNTYDADVRVLMVASCYFAFLLLYSIWDFIERFQANSNHEIIHMNKVLKWELVSMLLLLVYMLVIFLFKLSTNPWILIILLIGITGSFLSLTLEKSRLEKDETLM